MKRLSDNFLTMLLPLTVVAATAFGLVAAVAFRMEATTAAFVFTALSIVGWIGLVVEFFLLYDIIIDKWLSKDRSVLTASWFVVSLLIAFILTPDKHMDWSTFIVMASLFAVLFLLPCIIGMAYGERIKSWLRQRWNRFVPGKRQAVDKQVEKQIGAVISTPTPPVSMKQVDEIRHYDHLISQVQPEKIKKLPEALQTNDALFLLVLFREDGYLGADFQPLMKKEDDEINQTLYAYIANALCAALKIRKGKWVIFEKFWPLNNGAQLASNLKAATKDNPSEHQRHIAKLLRKATRLRPRLDTYDLEEFKKL
ncbi:MULTISPECIES: hypothetical protein [Bacteroidales]|jgi:hypothetical protein|uniref:Uncharacterized protein n=1 Tax=Phocaeicola dorei TaxID=357276 RepID=A0A6A1IDM6_9BACT|nr:MULTISPECIES: hypothetical protein [Bacteroidales]EEO46247.2 hypothetical protein BSEG_02388 [Phocaeicola dorei 5_1_36/D4]KAA5396729.1 hypothetical protein F2Y58_14560 [Phocaeicola dorei]KAA5404090.1 hypothetical protein F2Y51_13625 [Phocaeicola dorei]MDC2425652.1 hypothetical protein [Bacteroides ovatus]MDC2430491.1 hypothetical protein [Bacteroides ovatus]